MEEPKQDCWVENQSACSFLTDYQIPLTVLGLCFLQTAALNKREFCILFSKKVFNTQLYGEKFLVHKHLLWAPWQRFTVFVPAPWALPLQLLMFCTWTTETSTSVSDLTVMIHEARASRNKSQSLQAVMFIWEMISIQLHPHQTQDESEMPGIFAPKI